MVIEEEWFYDINLTGGSTFPPALIKCAKFRFNKQKYFPRDTNQRIRKIVIKMVGTHGLSIYFIRNVMVNFISNKIC